MKKVAVTKQVVSIRSETCSNCNRLKNSEKLFWDKQMEQIAITFNNYCKKNKKIHGLIFHFIIALTMLNFLPDNVEI